MSHHEYQRKERQKEAAVYDEAFDRAKAKGNDFINCHYAADAVLRRWRREKKDKQKQKLLSAGTALPATYVPLDEGRLAAD